MLKRLDPTNTCHAFQEGALEEWIGSIPAQLVGINLNASELITGRSSEYLSK